MQMTSSRDDKQAEGQRDEPVPVPLTSLPLSSAQFMENRSYIDGQTENRQKHAERKT